MSSEDRGRYRAIHSVLLDSPEFLALSPSAKLLFYTLRFCRENTIACIFVLHSWGEMTRRTGLSLAAITRAQKELLEGHWIAYQYPIVWLRNGLKFSPDVHLGNPKHRQGILSTICSLPKLEIVAEFCTYYNLPIPIGYPSNSHANQGYRVGGMGKGTGIGVPVPENTPPIPPQGGFTGFDTFWSAYPKKEGRGKAEEAWKKYAKSIPLETILFGLDKWTHSQKWADGFITMPATWLNQRRWEDDPTPVSPLSSTGESNRQAAERLRARLHVHSTQETPHE